MRFTNFPVLIPAFTARRLHFTLVEKAKQVKALHLLTHLHLQIPIEAPLAITADLLNIPFVPQSGSLISEPGYPFALRAVFLHGSDYLRRDHNGEHVRLDVRSAAVDGITGAVLNFEYTGVVDLRSDAGKVIAGDGNATTTGFGDAFVQVRFETDHHGLQPLETKMYVGSGRFIVNTGEPIVVEYKISEVAAPCWGHQ